MKKPDCKKALQLVVLVFIAGMVFISGNVFAREYPKPDGLVNDFSGIMSAREQSRLEALCQEASRKANIQIAIVTMDEIPEGQDISAYAVELAHAWGIGRKGEDRGCLILFKTTQRRNIYLATGYGLEGDINDAKAGRILDQVTIPLIKQNRMLEAFAGTVSTIVNIVEPDVTLTGAPAPRQVRAGDDELTPSKIIGLIIMIIIFLIMSRSPLGRSMLFGMLLGSMMGGRRGGWGGGGGGFGGGFGGFGGGGFGGGGAGRGGF